MAEVERRRTLINPAKRKRRRNARRNRKMSRKQIAIFGTKRQKAALKASRKRKRTNAARRHSRKRTNARTRRRSAPRAHRSTRRHRARRKNPGGIVEVALNPAPKRRKRTVAKTTRRRKRRSNARRYHRRRNPAPVTHRRRRRHYAHHRKNRRRNRSYRRNPSFGGVSNLLVSAAYAIGGAVGSKYLTQMVLGASNTGYVGYAANLAAAFVGGKVVGMFTKNKQAENSVILGGVIMTLLRFLSEQTPIGSTLQQYGLGDYEASTWLTPARYVNAAQSAVVDLPKALRPAALPPGKAGMAGLRGSGTYSRTRGTY